MRLHSIILFLTFAFSFLGITSAEEANETNQAWRLENTHASWSISKATGQILGGWNAKTGERYLRFIEGGYHLEDRKSLVTGRESSDKVLHVKFDEANQRIELACTNSTLPDLSIRKRYWLDGNKLYHRVAFRTKSQRLQFITCNVQVAFVPTYRKGSFYMGGADGGGPLVPAPAIDKWAKMLQYKSTTKGMVLSQPKKGYSFAHVRTRLDDQFVWPWFTGAIASYVERMNVMHYTPDGWDMSLGTSKLSAEQETSFEQFLSIFDGDWQTFLRREYPALPAVKKALHEIPPVPEWVNDVKIYTGSDMQRLRQMVEMTDEGTIMVMISLAGSWSDYYVERGMSGGYGGWVTGPELRDWIQRIRALSPRIKVGLYMWVLSTTDQTRIYKEHPEWFRYGNKDGQPLSTFPGFWNNFAHLLSIRECYQELLSQFDHVLSYLGTDYIYLDDPKAINMIDWRSGEFTRDDLSFKFFRDLKRLVARHGPDKVLFFNNRGNPYADINFIEARAQLRANYWRRFTGIGAVCQEFVSATRPNARIIPLYYTTPLRREYMNRVLALGWIPSLTYTDVIASRPYFQAAYEVGNCAPIAARYSPDWKRDAQTKVESYAVKRHGDNGALLSFINHADAKEDVSIRIDLGSLGLDEAERIFVWKYVIENALEHGGTVTESWSRKVYARTGWQLDRVSRRELLYAGPHQKELRFNIKTEPLLLNQLYVTTQPAAIYSENYLPANYLFGQKVKVKLKASADWYRRTIEIQIDSQREHAEVVLFLPVTTHDLKINVDGVRAPVTLVCEGEDILPVVRVSKGRHHLSIAYEKKAVAHPVTVKEFSAMESLRGITINLPGYEQAFITIRKKESVMFNRMITKQDGRWILPNASALDDASPCTAELRAVVDEQGVIRPVKNARASFELAATLPDVGAQPRRPTYIPERRELKDVNRKIKGLEILRSGTHTTATILGEGQPEMESLVAETDPDALTIEAGTTRALLQGQRGGLGAAFAGLEFKNLQKVRVKLSNTFHNAFHMRGPEHHAHNKPSTREFAGIIIDYHTPDGYSHRARLALVMHGACNSRYPRFGRSEEADVTRKLGKSLIESPEKTFSLDLRQHAPKGWDGQVWFSVGTDVIAPNRRLKLEILAANDAVTGPFLEGTDPKAFLIAYNKPRILRVPRSPGGIITDGSPDEEMWRGAAITDQFFLYAGKGVSKAQTTAMALYDDKNLYVAFTCLEPDRKKPFIIGGAPWNDDVVEVWIDANKDRKTYRQVILNAINEKLEYGEAGRTNIGAKAATHIVENYGWSVEMRIPFKGLGVKPPKKGDTWRISLCRGRPPGKKIPSHELIVWAPLRNGGFRDLENFGTVIFQ